MWIYLARVRSVQRWLCRMGSHILYTCQWSSIIFTDSWLLQNYSITPSQQFASWQFATYSVLKRKPPKLNLNSSTVWPNKRVLDVVQTQVGLWDNPWKPTCETPENGYISSSSPSMSLLFKGGLSDFKEAKHSKESLYLESKQLQGLVSRLQLPTMLCALFATNYQVCLSVQ